MTTNFQMDLDQELMRAILSNNTLAVRAALKKGANPARLADNPFLAGEQLLTGLHFGSMRGSPEVLRLLLEAGVSPNMEDQRGNTPLHACVGAADPKEQWKVLCDAGADPAHANHRGVTPRMLWEKQFGYAPEEGLSSWQAQQTPGFSLPPPEPERD
jgi:ankyrin repeat protein